MLEGWETVLKAFAALGPKKSRHPDDVVRGVAGPLNVAKGLAAEGWLFRSAATGYFVVTDMGMKLAATLP